VGFTYNLESWLFELVKLEFRDTDRNLQILIIRCGNMAPSQCSGDTGVSFFRFALRSICL
jgi:hypothetical protein